MRARVRMRRRMGDMVPWGGRICQSRLGDAGQEGAHAAVPEGRVKGDEAGQRQGPGQQGGVTRQAQGRVGTRRVGVVVGMAGRVQHQGRGIGVGGVPAVRGGDGGKFAIGGGGAGQAVVLDIIRQQDLAAHVQPKTGPDQQRGQAGDQVAEAEGQYGARYVKGIGVEAGMAFAEGGFGGPALAKAARPGAGQEAVEAFPGAGGVGVIAGGHKAVMHKAVGGGVVTEEEGGIKGCAEPEQGPRAVDQFMGGRVADLAEPEASRHEQADPVRQGQRAGAGDGQGEKRQGSKSETPEGHEQGVGQGKFAVRGGARDPGGQKVKGHGGGGHVKDCKQWPDPAKRCPKGE